MRNTIAIALGAVLSLPVIAHAAAPDWDAEAKALGKSGSVQTGGVYRVGLPRSDLKVTLDGLALEPGFALGGWVAFEPMGDRTMLMGDLVLTQDEVTPVMRKLEQDGISVTALHNHLLRATPETLFLHVMASGDALKLATGIHDALAESKTPLGGPTSATTTPPKPGFDTGLLERRIGYPGKANGDIYQFTIPRAKPVTEDGMAVPAAMGSAIGINIQTADGQEVAATGDFVLSGDEVNPVIKAMADHNIEVAAVHSHMLDEEPRMFFLHFWAKGNLVDVADGLRAALDKVDIAK